MKIELNEVSAESSQGKDVNEEFSRVYHAIGT
jgi:hypothetical protein